MKYQNLLYSRSPNRDYRWILAPQILSSQDYDKIEELVWSEELRTTWGSAQTLFPLFLLRLSASYALTRFYRTSFLDRERRPIDCIDGIVVQSREAWFLRFSLAWILKDYVKTLDSWSSLEYSGSDALLRSEPEQKTFDLGLLAPKQIAPEANPIQPQQPGTSVRQLPFTAVGLETLLALLYPAFTYPTLRLLQIAFGVSRTNMRIYDGFEIIAVSEPPASGGSSTNDRQDSRADRHDASFGSGGFEDRVRRLRKGFDASGGSENTGDDEKDIPPFLRDDWP